MQMPDKEPEKTPEPAKKLPPRSRRGFFEELLHTVATPMLEMADEKFNLGLKDLRRFVRPPGAIPESQFTERCDKSGYCVEACPVKAIIPLPEYRNKKLAGTPVVVAETQPCVMCYDLACMAVCPTARSCRWAAKKSAWAPPSGMRRPVCDTRGEGGECRICVDKCPFHERVITLDAAGKVAINPDTCTGCGVCAFDRPTNPKSIVIDPV